ncbi:glutathione hydrolase 5 proenzyme isoform X2 [Oryzias latipes]|uniref:Gamma-glutamyltransferase 5a n=1 Tax=Oryzias latipes TaxID=8090 RepID=A0A3B3HYU5_ORYLA|nr:glutathione hydrolase 5 proenzyme isoform X2 [Oryzias latipes]
MARSKAKVYLCCALILISFISVIVCIAVFTRPRCPFSKAAVATDSEICSGIGRAILKEKGGSAVDAAIAALLCTFVANPHSAGIGGGTIFTVMDSSGDVRIINSREASPTKVKSDLLKSCPEESMTDVKWIGVPGEIRGYEAAHKLYGKLPWADLFQPAIKLAREGIPISDFLHSHIENIPNSNETQSLRKLFTDNNNNFLKAGDFVKFEKLADTLEMIANQGPDVFYTGKIAEDLVQDVKAAGGTLELQDLASYKATLTDAWNVSMGEYRMYFPPPPAAGSLLTLILNIMRGFPLNPDSLTGKEKTLFYHRYIESFKFANGLKKYIRDPRFTSEKRAKEFTEESFANYIRSFITDDKTHELQFYNVTPHLDSTGTTHVSVLHEDGSAVAVTSTINYIFGSRVVSPRTGIILNNELRDFCGRADSILPGERPPSSMSPVVLKSKSRTLTIGGSGGGRITTAMASALINHLWLGKSLKDAIYTSIAVVDSENAVDFERDFDKDVIEGLKALGHNHTTLRKFYNSVNAVEKKDGCIFAVSDFRKKGKPDGY